MASLWSYVLVAYGLMLWWLTGLGQLVIGNNAIISDEAHLSGVGNSIRMVMSHFIELKKCADAKSVAFRKARL